MRGRRWQYKIWEIFAMLGEGERAVSQEYTLLAVCVCVLGGSICKSSSSWNLLSKWHSWYLYAQLQFLCCSQGAWVRWWRYFRSAKYVFLVRKIYFNGSFSDQIRHFVKWVSGERADHGRSRATSDLSNSTSNKSPVMLTYWIRTWHDPAKFHRSIRFGAFQRPLNCKTEVLIF